MVSGSAQRLTANPCFYALATLAYDVLQALKRLYLPESELPKRVRTLIHHLLLIPVEIGRHARQIKASWYAPAGWVAGVVGGAVAEVAIIASGGRQRLRVILLVR